MERLPRNVALGRAFAAALVVLPGLAAGQGLPNRPSLLRDTARFTGAEWSVKQLVTLDSSKTSDTLAIREVGRAEWIAPGRVVFIGRATKGGKWGLYFIVDGALKRMLVSGQEFTGPDGRKRKVNADQGFVRHTDGVAMLSAAGSRFPNEVLFTNGVEWRRVFSDKDTVDVAGSSVVIDGFGFRGADADGRLLFTIESKAAGPKAPATIRYVRLNNAMQLEPLVILGDSLPDVGRVEPFALRQILGIPSGLKEFIPSDGGWMGLLRTHEGGRKYIDHLLVTDGSGKNLRELFRADTFGMRGLADSVGFLEQAPNGDVILQRALTIGVVGAADGKWRQLLTADDVKPPKDGGFTTGEVVWLDKSSSRALLSVWLSQVSYSSSTSGVSVMRLWSMYPRMFYYDGTRAVEVRADTTLKADGTYVSWRPSTFARRVAGYDEGVIVELPATKLAPKRLRAVFDAATGTFVPVPPFRTDSGDYTPGGILGWNSENEVMVRNASGIAVLRRP